MTMKLSFENRSHSFFFFECGCGISPLKKIVSSIYGNMSQVVSKFSSYFVMLHF